MVAPIGDSWTFLLVGSLGATGLAMSLGTLAALVRYHRTGAWPSSDGERGGAADVTTGRLVSLWGRVVVGLVIAGYAAVSLDTANLL